MLSSRAFSILKVVYLSLLFYHCLAVPIGRVIGCGKEDPDLSPEQRKFCCESFSLDCEDDLVASRSQSKPPTEPVAKRQTIYEQLVPKRKLGSPCREPIISCSAGLECRMGLCRRVRSQKHLERLLERGKQVEREEKEDLEDGPESSQRREKDGELTLQGQSISVEHVYPRGIPRPNWYSRNGGSNEKLDEAFDASNARKTALEGGDGVMEGNSSIFEEDEVAANVADLLASRLHISLNASQVHSIRDVIAGTLDERAQREDEADRAELAKLDTALLSTSQTGNEDGSHNYTCSAPVVNI